MPDFELISDYTPQGDQGEAIKQLVSGVNDGTKHQVLLGVTGSGKTFTAIEGAARLIQQEQEGGAHSGASCGAPCS